MDTYPKFENSFLQSVRTYGGSPISVILELTRLYRAKTAHYQSHGLINFDHLLDSLSAADLELLLLINAA